MIGLKDLEDYGFFVYKKEVYNLGSFVLCVIMNFLTGRKRKNWKKIQCTRNYMVGAILTGLALEFVNRDQAVKRK